MNEIDNILPFYFWHDSYLEIQHIFVPFNRKKATAVPPDESDEEHLDDHQAHDDQAPCQIQS